MRENIHPDSSPVADLQKTTATQFPGVTMTRSILLEELHMTFHAPGPWSEERRHSAVRILRSRDFRRRLRKAIQSVLDRSRELKRIRWRLER